jgi:hypothetical protein
MMGVGSTQGTGKQNNKQRRGKQMAKVHAKVTGGDPIELTVDTVGEVKRKLSVPNHTANVNGRTAGDQDLLKDEDFVLLAPAAKGA